MSEITFDQAVELICSKDKRYEPSAYRFLRAALEYTTKTFQKHQDRSTMHVSGQELLAGIRAYALELYGPMAYTVLTSWGLERSEDFGEMVFSLIRIGIFRKEENDSKSDFSGCYTFHEAFVAPFLPKTENIQTNTPETIGAL